ncbi:hypothetical protein FOXYSP1_15325 [Fusarium oxysporum f. sp. phaseoli]
MNGTKPRESLSSGCIVKCMLDAYANDGDALVVQINLDAIREGHYGFVVVLWLRYHLLLHDDFAVESPQSGEPIDDKCALDAFSVVEVAGYEVLAWQPYREEASPFMDRAGNTLPIRERPPLKSPEKEGDTVKDSTISDLRKQNLELKKRLKQQEIEKLRLYQLQRTRRTVLENVKELGFIHKKVKDREVTYNLGEKDQHPAEKHAADQLHECYDHEHASNGQYQRLLKIASERKDGYDEIEKANMAVFEAEEKMEASEQNLLQ